MPFMILLFCGWGAKFFNDFLPSDRRIGGSLLKPTGLEGGWTLVGISDERGDAFYGNCFSCNTRDYICDNS